MYLFDELTPVIGDIIVAHKEVCATDDTEVSKLAMLCTDGVIYDESHNIVWSADRKSEYTYWETLSDYINRVLANKYNKYNDKDILFMTNKE